MRPSLQWKTLCLCAGGVARTVPIIISFLARFLGLGGIGKKIKQIIEKVRKPIVNAVDKGIKKISTRLRAWFSKSKGGRKKVSDKQVDKEEKNANQRHQRIAKQAAKEFKKLTATQKKMPPKDLKKDKEKQAEKLEKKYNKQLEAKIKMKIKFTKPLKEDLEDGDLDFQIKIAPNDTINNDQMDLEDVVKVNGTFLDSSSMKSYDKKEIGLTEEQEGKEVVGKKGKVTNDGFVVGRVNSKSAYVTARNDKKDYEKQFNILVNKGSYAKRKSHIEGFQSRAAKAEGYDEPLKSLILDTDGVYRKNLITDIEAIFSKYDETTQDFIDIYKKIKGGEFPKKLSAIEAKAKKGTEISKAEIEDLFKGYHAHHFIPANLLWNNETVKELLEQGGIEFKFNNIENLIFMPAENHLKENYRGHPEYDKGISDRIRKEVAPLVDGEKYQAALAALRMIISQTKDKIRSEYLGTKENIDRQIL